MIYLCCFFSIQNFFHFVTEISLEVTMFSEEVLSVISGGVPLTLLTVFDKKLQQSSCFVQGWI